MEANPCGAGVSPASYNLSQRGTENTPGETPTSHAGSKWPASADE